MRAAATVLALGCLVMLSACGGSGDSKGARNARTPPNPNDKRAAGLACLTDGKGLDARPLGADSVQVGDARTGPRIKFFLTRGEAEAYQFEGNGEGSEQIGPALLFTRGGTEDVLNEVEACLDSL